MNWPIVPLGELADSVDYGVTAPATSEPVGPKFLRITDIQNDQVDWNSVPYCEVKPATVEAARLLSGDIVFARTGATTGKSFLVRKCPDSAVFASYLIRVRPGKKLDPAYLARFFQSDNYWNQIRLAARGAAQPGVNSTVLKALKIPVAPFEAQRRIMTILDAADRLRDQRRSSIQKLDALRRSIFVDMFGDPAKATAAKFTSIGMALEEGFLSGIQDGNHGEKHPLVVDFAPVGIPFVTANCFQGGSLNLAQSYRLPESWLTKLRVGFARPGDVLLTHKGTIGEVALAPQTEKDLILSPQVTYYRTTDRLSAAYLAGYFTS
jgi:type I restriction enzyme S subunit